MVAPTWPGSWDGGWAKPLKIPLFLYEAAAAALKRRNLADLRLGEFEGLQEVMEQGHMPDFGPASPSGL